MQVFQHPHFKVDEATHQHVLAAAVHHIVASFLRTDAEKASGWVGGCFGLEPVLLVPAGDVLVLVVCVGTSSHSHGQQRAHNTHACRLMHRVCPPCRLPAPPHPPLMYRMCPPAATSSGSSWRATRPLSGPTTRPARLPASWSSPLCPSPPRYSTVRLWPGLAWHWPAMSSAPAAAVRVSGCESRVQSGPIACSWAGRHSVSGIQGLHPRRMRAPPRITALLALTSKHAHAQA